jgi:DNA-binding transcriptional LysR family regulator
MTMSFDLTDIRLFLSVVEQGSLTRGAHAMHLALASASERVSRMEDALGTPLLERSRRGVRPTPAGDALVRHARTIVAQVEQMRGDLRYYATGLKGRIRLWSNTAALADFLPRRLCGFLKDHADLAIDVLERPSADIALALAQGRADLGVVADITDLTALQASLLAQDRLVVVASKRHRFHDRSSLGFIDIVDEPFVGLSDGALEIHLGEHAARLGRQMDYRIKLRGVEDIGMLVEAGIGIAVISEASIAHLRAPELTIAPLAEPWAVRSLYICARDFSALSPHARLLAKRLLENASSG